MSSIYVSGPMRGYEQFNFPAFDDLSAQLRSDGYTVINPADHDREVYPDIEKWEGFEPGSTELCPQFDLHAALAWDLAEVAKADEFVLLPGWEESSGATHERYVAEVTGKPIWIASREAHSVFSIWRLEFDEKQRRVSEPQSHERIAKIAAVGSGVGESRVFNEYPPAAEREAKRTFSTGATRDAADHKHDPEGFLSPIVIRSFNTYMHENRQMADGSLRASDNWQKGIPFDAYMKSMWRHFLDVWTIHRGTWAVDYDGNKVDMEHALNGVLFNVMGYLHELLKPIDETPTETLDRIEKRLDLAKLDLASRSATMSVVWTDNEMKRVDL